MLKEGPSGRAVVMTEPRSTLPPKGMLAAAAGKAFALEVCKSAAGFYIGTRDEDGAPFTRESREYWQKRELAETALSKGLWTQKPSF
jgi:hypothetical protein